MKPSLNHIYRSIWSEALNAWVAVSEVTSAKGKRSGSSVLHAALTASASHATQAANREWGIKRVALALACCFTFHAAQANPLGAQVVNGTAAINQIGNTLTVTNSPNAIINWQSFSINSGETTRFVQQSASSAVLNRVVGADPSQLLGTLTSNGKVFLINPNGILVGQGGRIDVAGFVASTLNLSNEDFLTGKLNFGLTPGAGSIQNAGSITTPEGGTVYLVAPQVENQGIITTPKGETLLAAGNTVQLLDTGTPGVTVQVTGADNGATNVGQILADSGRIGMVGAVVRNSGTISASSIVSEGGRVFLKASKDLHIENNARVEASGTQGGTIEALGNRVAVTDNASLDASGQYGGGTVLVGGDYQGKNSAIQNAAVTYFGPNASIKADALNNGNGGKVILWADDTTRAYGSISVRGGAAGGNGGFVETSGRRYLDVTRAPDLSAPLGKSGSWLLDPEDIIISASASSNNTGTTTFTPAAAGSSILSDAVLRAALVAGGAVTVDTTGGGAGTGNILVDGTASLTSISAGAGAVLNLKAHNDITVNSSITAAGQPLAMNLIADQDSNGSGAININNQIITNNGNFVATAAGDISFLVPSGQNIIDTGTGTASLTSTLGRLGYGVGYSNQFYVMGSGVTLSAKSGIGGGGSSFHTRVGSIAFSNSTSGNVDIYNDALAASSFSGTNNGGQVLLQSYYQTAPTTIGAITAAGDVLFRMNNIDVTGPVNAGVNTVYAAPYTFNAPASINGSAQFDLTGAEISNISASKIVVGYDTFGNYASNVDIGTLAVANITNGAKLEVIAPSVTIGGSGFTNTNTGGALSLKTDNFISGGGAINVGATGTVMISGKNETQIDLGGADSAGILGLGATGVNAITAGKLIVGDANTASMVVSSTISPTVTTLILNSGTGGISGPGSLNVSNLAIRSIGSVDLGTSYSSVGNLAASVGNFTTPNNPNFKFKNTPTLNVGANIDGLSGISIAMNGTYNPGSPDGVIALISNNGLTQSAGALLAGKAVYAEGKSVNLTQANPTGVISGKAMGNTAGDVFNYTSSNGIAVTTVNGFSGIQAVSVTEPMGILLNAGSAGISQDPTASIIGSNTGLLLNTTGPVNLNASGNNVFAVGTAANSAQFNFNNNGALTVGVNGNGIATTNQSVNITANGLLTVKDGITAGTSWIALEAPDIQVGVTATPGTTISGDLIKLRANKVGSAGTISTAGTTASTLSSTTGIALEADNINFAVAPNLNAGTEVGIRTYTDNRSITIGGACNGADLSCLLLSGAFLSSANVNAPDLVIGNEHVADTNTAGNIHVDAVINHAGRVALITGGSVDQTAAITTTGLGIIAGGSVTLNAGNAITNIAGQTAGGSFSFTNGQTLNVVTETGGLGPNIVTLSGITAPGGVTLQTTGAASNIVLNNAVTSGATGDAVVLAAGGNFINNLGAGAISTPNGRWLVYSTSPLADTFGGLNSNNTAVWNTTIAGTPPANVTQPGNRYLFSYQPTVTFTSVNTSKTYGVDATTGVANAYGVSGVNPGVANAYLGDTNAIAFSGLPSVTSSGSVATALVSGSPYAINVTQGTLSALNGYALAYSSPGTLTVNPAALTVTANSAVKTYGVTKTYTGTEFVPVGLANGETIGSITLSSTGDAPTASVLGGPYAINASAATGGTFNPANYSISYVSGALTVNPATLTVTANSAVKTYGVTKTYSGAEFVPVGLANGETIGSVTLSSTGDAPTASVLGGPYTINASAATGGTFSPSNYSINYVGGTLSVSPAALTVTANPFIKTYDGVAYSGGNGVSYSGFVNGETSAVIGGTLAYSGSSQGAVNAGGYLITPNGLTSGNYSIGYVSGALTVNPAALTITANPFIKTYDGLAYSGGNGVSYTGFVNGETSAVLGGALAYSGSSQGAVNAGGYVITPGGLTSGNYTISYANGALTVNPAALTVTANPFTKTYDKVAYTGGNGVAYTGFVNGETSAVLGGTLAYSGSSQGAVNAGSYVITPGGLTSGNYTISYANGALTVNKAVLDLFAVTDSKAYDGTTSSAGVVTHTGLLGGDTVTGLAQSFASKDVLGASGSTLGVNGGYAITDGNAGNNYAVTLHTASGTITPVALNVTANAASKTYDGLAYSGGNGASYSGFVNGETSAVLGGTLAYSGSSQGAVNAGSYVIIPSGLSSGNYTIGYTNGSLTVNPAALTIAANGHTVTYDGLAYGGGNGVTYTGLVNGETSAVLGGTLAYGGTSQGATNIGSYLITPSGLTSSNYTIGYVDGTLSIVPPITPATTATVQTVATVTTTSTTSATTTTASTQTTASALDANALISTAPTSSTGTTALVTADTSGGGIGGTAGTFGSGESTSAPAAAPEGTSPKDSKGAESTAKKDDKDKKDEVAKKDDKAKKDEGNAKDDASNKDKKNAKPEKC